MVLLKILPTLKYKMPHGRAICARATHETADLNEQGQWCKGPEKIRRQVTHVPLLVRVPGAPDNGHRVAGIARHADVFPILLGRLGLKPGPRVTGQDLWPYVTGEKTSPREYIVSAYGGVASVRNPE
jgi:arylsulfatase A-like enzyme